MTGRVGDKAQEYLRAAVSAAEDASVLITISGDGKSLDGTVPPGQLSKVLDLRGYYLLRVKDLLDDWSAEIAAL